MDEHQEYLAPFEGMRCPWPVLEAVRAERDALRADRDWWRRTCWLACWMALVASGGWAWTVIR